MLNLFFGSLNSQPTGCRAAIDGTWIHHFGGYVSIPRLYDSLSTHFSYFRVDSPTSEISFDSVDVYFVPPRFASVSYSDSLILEFRKFIYNGGILFMFGENCSFWSGTFGIIYDSLSGWFLGIEPAYTTVYDPINNARGGWSRFLYLFNDYPILPEFSEPVIGDLGSSIYVTSPAITLASSYETGYSVLCSDTSMIDEYGPAVLAMVHYGRGLIFFHSDFTAIRQAWALFIPNENLGLILALTDCSRLPRFSHSPLPGNTFFCFEDTVRILTSVFNFGAIEPESLRVLWRDSIYDFTSPLIQIHEDNFVFSLPPHSYHDGDTVSLCIDNIVDTSGFWRYDSICWEYYVEIDEYPPELSGFNPIPGDTLDSYDTISLIATDTSGIDTTSIQFTFLDTTLNWWDTCIWISGDTVFFDPILLDFSTFETDTTLLICFHIQDDNKQCIPNPIDTCWSFVLRSPCIDREPPDINILYPSEYETLLILDTVAIIAMDSSGIDTSSILFTFLDSTITWGDSCIWLIGDTIYFDPICAGLNPGWVDTILTVCVHLQDNVVECSPNAIDTCWSFYLNASGIYEVHLPGDFEIKAYPNPFNSRCYISGPDGLKAGIFDVSGRFIKSIKLPGIWEGKNEKGEEVGSGIYFLRINGERQKILRILLLK
ncbi:T9SS type A sorting domain-containing protein [bacterium]|nr:T9SS type A sorting domain-containing protein [bacterium]